MAGSLENEDYASSGVSIKDGNEVAQKIKAMLKARGINTDGLFGGAVDISKLKGNDSVPIGIACTSIHEKETSFDAGHNTCLDVLEMSIKLDALATLDYYASADMDDELVEFVRGVTEAGIEHNIPIIGGESAQMPGTYKEDKERDAYVDLIFHGKTEGEDSLKTVDIADLINDMERPLLCASTDGTGTKTRIVRNPKDIIYHGLNDLGAIGVKPVAFKLYVAGNATQEELDDIVTKSEAICETLGITALTPTVEIKTAEYETDQVDIAGTVLGVVDEKDMITGKNVKEGDVMIGIATDGLMTNGYSYARKCCKITGHDWDAEDLPGLEGTSIRKELSRPHVPYTDILFGNDQAEGILTKFQGQIKATAHITGGGLEDNIPRMIPDGLCAAVKKQILPIPRIVQYFRTHEATFRAMEEALNMGTGYEFVVDESIAGEVSSYINTHFRFSVPGVTRTAAKMGVIEKASKIRYVID